MLGSLLFEVFRRNLGNANDKQDYRIIEEFAYIMMDRARKTCYSEDFELDVDGNVYALDSSTIDLCMSVFWWAKFRSTKAGIKLHTLYDVKTSTFNRPLMKIHTCFEDATMKPNMVDTSEAKFQDSKRTYYLFL